MAKIKLNLDYKVKVPEGTPIEDQDKDYSEISRGYIDYAVSASHRDGLSGGERRIFSRIQSKVEEAIENKTYEIDLEEKDLRFLQDCFLDDKAKFQASLAKYVVIFEDELLKDLKAKN